MSYAFDGDVLTWTPDQPFPDAVRNYKGEIRCHNSTFERLIFWYVLGINFKLEQFYCTATQARANCLPGSLEDIGRAMSLTSVTHAGEVIDYLPLSRTYSSKRRGRSAVGSAAVAVWRQALPDL